MADVCILKWQNLCTPEWSFSSKFLVIANLFHINLINLWKHWSRKEVRDRESLLAFVHLPLWKKKTDSAQLTAKPPATRSLLPTNESLELNNTSVPLQRAYWEKSINGEPPKLDPCKLELEENPYNPSLTRPVMMPTGLPVTPEEILRITKCNCSNMFTQFYLIQMLFIQRLKFLIF